MSNGDLPVNTMQVNIFLRRTSKTNAKKNPIYDEHFIYMRFLLKLILIVCKNFHHKKKLIFLSKRKINFSKFSIFLQLELLPTFDLNSLTIIHYVPLPSPINWDFWPAVIKPRRRERQCFCLNNNYLIFSHSCTFHLWLAQHKVACVVFLIRRLWNEPFCDALPQSVECISHNSPVIFTVTFSQWYLA